MIKKAQVWVETAVYTLIALIIISILLSLAYPQIEKIKDNSVIKQTIIALNVLDNKVIEVQEKGIGNVRKVDLKISKGFLEIDSENNEIIYTLEDTKLEYSEIDEEINQDNLIIKTEKFGGRYKITIKRTYNSDILNITYDNEENLKTIYPGGTPYSIIIENKGEIEGKLNIDFKIS